MEANPVSVRYTPIEVMGETSYVVDIEVRGGAAEPAGEELERDFLMLLDNSGSMAGGPFRSLQQGAQ